MSTEIGRPIFDSLSRRTTTTAHFSVLMDRAVLTLLFNTYHSLPSKYAAKTFQCVVQLASVRRLLFDQSDRQKYLQSLVAGVKSVLGGDTLKLEDQVRADSSLAGNG